MTETLAASQERRQAGLWSQAPGWRNLVIAATLLTGVAVALPLYLSGEDTAPAPHRTAAPARIAARPAQAPGPVVPAHPAAHAHLSAIVPPAAQTQAVQPQAAQAQVQAQPQVQQACSIVMPNVPHMMSGTIVGVIPHERSLNIFRNTALFSGGTVNPAYVDNMRVMVRPDSGTNGGSHNPVVPSTLHVAVGDHVTYQTPYRDPTQTCGFYPSQVVADQGPQAAPAGTDAAQ
jgi:hypothetical protein